MATAPSAPPTDQIERLPHGERWFSDGFATMMPGSRRVSGPKTKELVMSDNAKLFARIAPLFDVGLLSEAQVLIAGCGSGGSQVALQLAMAGVSKFALLDNDELEAENVIRHACGLR